MALKSKFVLMFAGVFISLAILEFAVQQIVVYPSFINLERQEAIQNLKRCTEAIQSEIQHLDNLCHDWAAWDDTYDFMQTRSGEYIESNLLLESYKNALINLIFMVNPDNTVVWGKIFDIETQNQMAVAHFSVDRLPDTMKLFQFDSNTTAIADVQKNGILITDKGLLILAARPVVRSSGKGPPRGTLIMGRFLTTAAINRLKNQAKVNFQIICNALKESADIKGILNRIAPENQYIITEKNQILEISTAFAGLEPNSAFLLQTTFPREISRNGFETIRYALLFLMLAGLVILLFILIIIQFKLAVNGARSTPYWFCRVCLV